MTISQSTFVKANWFSASTLIFLIGFLVYQSRWQQSVDTRLQSLETHTTDKTMHMPFERKIEVFVPRTELDGRLNSIDASLKEIKAALKR